MSRLLVAALLLFLASERAEAFPDPTKSLFDPILVGNSSGADMGNTYHVVVRDVGNVPLAGYTVTIRFLTSPARPHAQQDAGTTADCAGAVISKVSNFQGEANFLARVAGYDNQRAVEVRANGVLFGTILVRSTDLNGDGITGLADLNVFRERYLLNPRASETDFNRDGITNLADLELFRAEYVTGTRGTVCP